MPAKSKSQQKLMGMAYAYKKGDLDTSDIDKKLIEKIKKLSNSMSLKKLKQYASTKQDNIPEVKENIITKFGDFQI